MKKRRPQEGNAAWRASRATTQCKPGLTNRRQCKRCNAIAVKGTSVCYAHGGASVIARKRLHRRKLRYGNWTAPQSEIKRWEAERAQRFADAFHDDP